MRNEKADEFLALVKEWAVLCDKYVQKDFGSDLAGSIAEEDDGSVGDLDEDEFVVEKLIGICYGGNGRDNGLYFKVLLCCFVYQVVLERLFNAFFLEQKLLLEGSVFKSFD